MPLTGRFTFRRTFWGKIVLQVEEDVRSLWCFWRKDARRLRWRDATLMDLAQVELRPLMDLRHRPLFPWERSSPPGGSRASVVRPANDTAPKLAAAESSSPGEQRAQAAA